MELMSAMVAAASALMLVRAAALVSAVRLDQASGLGRLSWLWSMFVAINASYVPSRM